MKNLMKESVFHIKLRWDYLVSLVHIHWYSLMHVGKTLHIPFDEDIFPQIAGHKAVCTDVDK